MGGEELYAARLAIRAAVMALKFGFSEAEKESVVGMLIRSGWRIDDTGCVGEEPDDIGEIAALYEEMAGKG